MRRRNEEERVTFNPVDVLVGLSPSLVEDLATFVGSSEEDLLVSFQIMPWGDRAALAAFGIVELSDKPGERGRVIKVASAAVDLVNAAFEALQAGELVARPERSAVLAGAAVPLVHVVSETGREPWSDDDDALAVPATIESVDRSAAYSRLRIMVPVSDDPLGRRDVAVEVASLAEEVFTAGTTVRLLYSKDSASIGHPSQLKVEDKPRQKQVETH
jgi:hypothetical protein